MGNSIGICGFLETFIKNFWGSSREGGVEYNEKGPSRSYIRDLQFVFSFWGVWDPPEAMYEICNSYLVSGGVWDPPEAIYEIYNSYLVPGGGLGPPRSYIRDLQFVFSI